MEPGSVGVRGMMLAARRLGMMRKLRIMPPCVKTRMMRGE
jgi:hypothetical protein